jgi:D-alanine-D-alanine ligase
MKKKIAIVAGGDSGEYGISIKSGDVVSSTIDPEKYDAFLIQVKGKDWFFEKDGKRFEIDKNDFSLNTDSETVHFDAVFCAIHGTPGENGKLPAYFEMMNIPCTSSDSITSALTFNKNFCNRVVASWGVNVANSLQFYNDGSAKTENILASLKLPLFVKPNCGGSSVGMSKVNKVEELDEAIKIAFREDTQILIEEFVPGRELTCGVLQHQNKMTVFPVVEVISKKEFFDYEAKYNPALSQEIIPAPITTTLEIKIKETSAFLYKKLNCKGVVRFDYIYSDKSRKLFFLEVNTVPGLTSESIVPKMAREMGITLQELFTMLIEDAIWRNENR